MERKKISIKFEKICSKKVTVKNINFREKQFCTFWTEFGNTDYVRSMSEGLQKVKVRKFTPIFSVNEKIIDLSFPFTHNIFPIYIKFRSYTAFYSGRIKIQYYIEDHKNFGVDLYFKNVWAGNSTCPLIHFSFLEFRLYINLLLEKISYYSKKKITFSVEIDFDLEGEYCNERENIEMDKEAYFIAIYR